ncbi:kinase-like domain-containing protein [Mycena galopus ATCC 62051]|nr:kinase-like domain-containing protein [Mycena galopus ATCC 62051]
MQATMTTSNSKILTYEASLSFLKSACNAGPSGARMLRKVDDYIALMTVKNVVSAMVESSENRKSVLELSNELDLMNDPGLRTAMRADEERIAAFLVSILSSETDEDAVMRLEGDSAQHFLDVVQETLDRGFMITQEHARMALRIIRKLSESCEMLPSSVFIVGVNARDEHPSFGGGFGDIYRAMYGDQPVALKRMRYFLRGSDLRRIRLKFCREALVWKDLHHPHILPFLGIDRDSFPSSLCMVSPWMEHGTVMNYLKGHGHANVDKLLHEIAQGLEYLHSCNIVHGDLRGGNILIKEDWSACLTDFGLSVFSDATATMSTTRSGSFYWMAPELLDPERFGLKFARTPATDVYAFGCVCFELYTGRPPFSSLTEPAVLMKLLNGERPEKPSGYPVMPETLWQHVTEFLAESPSARPSTELVVQNVAWSTPGSHSSPSIPPSSSTVASTANTEIPTDTSFTHPTDGQEAAPEDTMSSLSRLLSILPVFSDGGTGTDVHEQASPIPEDRKSAALAHDGLVIPTFRELPNTDNSIHGLPPSSGKNKRWPAKPLDAIVNILPSESTTRLNHSADFRLANAVKEYYEILYDYSAAPDDPHEISFEQGDVVELIEKQDSEWSLVRKSDGSVGIAPSNCLQKTSTPTSSSLSNNPAPRPVPLAAATAMVRYEFIPSLPDELRIITGEIVYVLAEYADGWALCKNRRGGQGMVPLECLDRTAQTLQARTRNNDPRRTSSIPESQLTSEDPGSANLPSSNSALSAPNFLEKYKYKAKARLSYDPPESDKDGLSFRKGEILGIVNTAGKKWKVCRADGLTGTVLSYYFHVIVSQAEAR